MHKVFAGFFDLDGTLADGGAAPSARVVDALHAFQRAGNYIFLCTGRAPCFIYPAIADIGFDGKICGVGAHVRWGERMLYRRFLEPDKLVPLIDHFVAAGATGVLEGETDMFFLGADNDRTPDWYRKLERVGDGRAFVRAHPEQVITKMTVLYPYDDRDAVVVDPLADTVVYPGHAAEIVPKGCTKADGVRRVLEALGLPRENSLAFGDSENDRAMLTYAGTGVAMGNAPALVKAAADRVALSVAEDGVAVLLEQLLRENDG